MKNASIVTNVADATDSRAMESGDHFKKNGASLKSHTSRRNILRNACFALLVASVIFVGCSAGVSTKQERWEYEVLELGIGDYYVSTKPKLNSLGEEGWEVISISHQNSSVATFILKRRLP